MEADENEDVRLEVVDKALQSADGFGVFHALVNVLAQVRADVVDETHGFVQSCVVAGLVGTHIDQVLGFRI